jgi:TPR repeat protein
MSETHTNVIRAGRRYARIGLALLLASALPPVQGRMAAAQATDENGCPSGDQWLACRARAGDPGAMYAVGRSAYETARTSHDFTEALDWARRLDKMGDKNGERLLKMVYMQMGWGAHRDYVQAYAWLSEGIAGGADYLVQWRKMLAEKMTPEQVAAAKKLAGE